MSLDEFKRQVQNQFTVVLSWDEVRALQKLYGEPGELERTSSPTPDVDFSQYAQTPSAYFRSSSRSAR